VLSSSWDMFLTRRNQSKRRRGCLVDAMTGNCLTTNLDHQTGLNLCLVRQNCLGEKPNSTVVCEVLW